MIVWVYAFKQQSTLMDIVHVAVRGKHKVMYRQFVPYWS